MILKDLGEFNLIQRVSRRMDLSADVIKGIGDDAAVLRYKKDKYLLFTADMLLEGRHFVKSSGGYLIGKKSIAASVSDIAAMGGLPLSAVISLGVPSSLNVGFVDGLYRGIKEIAKKFKIDIVGGDTINAEKIIINIALIGEVEKGSLVLRSSARPCDAIFVTGEIGGSIKGKHLRFTPRIKESRFLVKNYKINSMIDVSDGLIADLNHILESSDRGAVIYEDAIPVSRHAKNCKSAITEGEDFELVFTMPQKDVGRLCKRWPFDTKLSVIGTICQRNEGLYLIRKNGIKTKIKPIGYSHF